MKQGRSDTFRFENRRYAGILLGKQVARLALKPPVLVLALPRGGVPVAAAVAEALDAPLDVLVVRKVGMPGQPELAIGAIASDGIVVHAPGAASFLASISPSFAVIAAAERGELRRRERVYRSGLPPLDFAGHTVVLVDDGVATGSSMLAAIRAARKLRAASVVVAAPVASPEAAARVAAEADRTVFLETPEILFAVGEWYERFEQLEDVEVNLLLMRAARRHPFKPPCSGAESQKSSRSHP
jgi:putative phosphoribosyl transferase